MQNSWGIKILFVTKDAKKIWKSLTGAKCDGSMEILCSGSWLPFSFQRRVTLFICYLGEKGLDMEDDRVTGFYKRSILGRKHKKFLFKEIHRRHKLRSITGARADGWNRRASEQSQIVFSWISRAQRCLINKFLNTGKCLDLFPENKLFILVWGLQTQQPALLQHLVSRHAPLPLWLMANWAGEGEHGLVVPPPQHNYSLPMRLKNRVWWHIPYLQHSQHDLATFFCYEGFPGWMAPAGTVPSGSWKSVDGSHNGSTQMALSSVNAGELPYLWGSSSASSAGEMNESVTSP